MMTSLGMAIVTEAFPSFQRGMALGISGSMVSIGTISGPVLGGILIDSLSWHWIFFVNLPIGIVGLLMVFLFIPRLKPQRGQRFDGIGAILLFLSVLCFLLALTIGQQIGFLEVQILLLFCGWILFLSLFIIQEHIKDQPMIDLRFFQDARFSIGLISGFGVFIALAGTTILMPFYLENVLGFDPRSVGLLMATVPALLGFIAPLSGFLSDRVGSRPITLLGLLVLLLGYTAVSTLNDKTSVTGIILRFLPIGIGMGIFQSPNNSSIMGSVTPTRLGVGSGMLALTRTLGQTTGIALLGAIWASRLGYYGQPGPAGGAGPNSGAAQVMSLRDTFIAVVALIFITLLVVLWGALRERKSMRSSRNPSYT
jgi:EmrB/QacA subfamily drug resistance transporter